MNIGDAGNLLEPLKKTVEVFFFKIEFRITSAEGDGICSDEIFPGRLCLETESSGKSDIFPEILFYG